MFKEKLYSAVLMLLYPGLLLIDHGHFQYPFCISHIRMFHSLLLVGSISYFKKLLKHFLICCWRYNCMSLGLMIWAVNLASKDHLCCSSILFVLALNYKQMELYHSTAFFFYFLGKIFSSNLTLKWRFLWITFLIAKH